MSDIAAFKIHVHINVQGTYPPPLPKNKKNPETDNKLFLNKTFIFVFYLFSFFFFNFLEYEEETLLRI